MSIENIDFFLPESYSFYIVFLDQSELNLVTVPSANYDLDLSVPGKDRDNFMKKYQPWQALNLMINLQGFYGLSDNWIGKVVQVKQK